MRSREGLLSSAFPILQLMGIPNTGHREGIAKSDTDKSKGTPAFLARVFALYNMVLNTYSLVPARRVLHFLFCRRWAASLLTLFSPLGAIASLQKRTVPRLRGLLSIEDNPDAALCPAQTDYLGLLADGELPAFKSPILPLAAEDDPTTDAEVFREAGVARCERVADALRASLAFVSRRV
jgi:hypothetical protein